MFDSLRDGFYRLKKEIGTEQIFKISPVYLLNGQISLKYIQYWLDQFRFDLEQSGGMLKSSTLISLSLLYNPKSTELGFFDESGKFKVSLDQWLSFIIDRYHVECGIILINIPDINYIIHDYIFFKQFVNDVRKNKKYFLFFIFSNEIEKIEPLLSTELFSIYYNVSSSTTDDFVNWVIKEFKENHISIAEVDRSTLKMLLDKYENIITLKMIDIWINTMIWNYYISEKCDKCFLEPEKSEDILVEIIEKNRASKNEVKIGFH